MFHYAVPEQVAAAITATVKKQQTTEPDATSPASVVELGNRPAA